MVGAYYDAMSVVPALAPGAESASGAAALLEVIRSLQRHGSRHSFLFLATSAHFEGLTGINDFPLQTFPPKRLLPGPDP